MNDMSVRSHCDPAYLLELEARKKESHSIVPTLKYSFFALISLLALFLGLVPLTTLPRLESKVLVIPGIILAFVGLGALFLSAFAAIARFLDWNRNRKKQ